MAGIILDASAFVKAVLPEPGSARVEELLLRAVTGADEVMVLQFAFTEAANAIWKRQQRNELAPDEALEALARLTSLADGVEVVADRLPLRRALAVSVALAIPVYDALALACAEADGLLLVTGDRRQARLGVQLSPPIEVELLGSEDGQADALTP